MNLSHYFKASLLSTAVILMFGCNEATSEPDVKSKELPVVEAPKPVVSAEGDIKQTIINTLHQKLGPVPVEKVKKSQLPGFYEVYAQGQVLYISEDQQFLLPGPLLSLADKEPQNLTQLSLQEFDKEKAPERAKLIASVDEDNMVVFKAPEEKYIVNVFTDVDCAYCRRLHQNLAGYLDLGITIRYLAFPRAGVGSGAYNKLVSVWCADDKQKAMNDAKLHNHFEPKECENPVADQYSMTREMGLSGTPTIVLGDGQLIGGFVEPAQLLQRLEKSKQG